ncbi:AMP-binding protein [Sinomicrobium weinanense]|uniref:AMP-binding protein n=1 Tax=Sinomicrobium weinanense TaxID=2842200 RepID=A0A926Q3T4_9FLAO|nr:AMP-binding protein [Sinomicrobium weinanense]MBC9797259.1 AMP-binding protein [Sinomicrobium weinanense]MBU3122339.1 AMP-binding protein [Sinomicrobium weinanense]
MATTDKQKLSITYKNIHNRFKINGMYFNREDLRMVACSFIKEGEPHEKIVGDFLLDWLDDRETIVVYTSGSTGKPKPVEISKQYMVNSAIATGNFFDITVGNTALLCLPADYIAGKMMLVRAMILGLEIDLVKPSSHPLEELKKDYDFSAMTPMQVQHSLSELQRIKKLIVGGAPMSGTLKASLSGTACKVYESYGMTETVSHIAARRVNGRKKEEIPCFSLLPGVKTTLDDRGCLVINAPNVADGPVVTNDLAELVSKKKFRWLGRYDNIVNSGGIKLIPEQIEEKIRPVIDGRFYVKGISDDRLGEKLVLFIEEKTNPGLGEKDLRKAIMELPVLDKYEIPKEIRLVEAFGETKSGKVLRHNDL